MVLQGEGDMKEAEKMKGKDPVVEEEAVASGQLVEFREIQSFRLAVLKNGNNERFVHLGFFPGGEEGARKYLGRWVRLSIKLEA